MIARSLLLALLLATTGATVPPPVDVVIRGGTIYTGADKPPVSGDVEISGDRITYVGPTRSTRASQIIDATGKIHGGRWLSVVLVSPGVPKVDGTNKAAKLVRKLSAADFAQTFELDGKGFFSAE